MQLLRRHRQVEAPARQQAAAAVHRHEHAVRTGGQSATVSPCPTEDAGPLVHRQAMLALTRAECQATGEAQLPLCMLAHSAWQQSQGNKNIILKCN